MKIDKSVINHFNKQTVINIIRSNDTIFNAEIARLAGLSLPTVMKITDEFIAKNLVIEIGKGESTGGKPPQLIKFNPVSHYIVGVDVGTTNIHSILMDLSANIKYEYTIPSKAEEPSAEIINRIILAIENTITKSGIEKDKILGIGVGMPGLLDRHNGIVLYSPDFKWENVDLVTPIKEEFNMPVLVNNVAKSTALGEKWFGLGRVDDNFITINLGYGIGGAIVINGELYSGGSDSAGEIGHMTVERNGPLCNCGNYGCLEALASADAMVKKARVFIEKGQPSMILQMANGDINSIEAKTIFDAAKQNDALALEIINEATEYIGMAVASMINYVDPSLIILHGGVSQAGDILINKINKVIARRRMKFAGRNAKIVTTIFGEKASAIGAAALIFERFIINNGNIDMD